MELLSLLAQMPPTPTMMPVPTAPLEVPQFGMWAATDDMLQIWNQNATFGYGAQILLLVALVVGGVAIVLFFVRSLGSDRDDS